ncbi:MAG: M23 family metallopeptidase [Bacillota bacterium]|nr:M23 family metallopeptidase [Bacillota bacterium]
METIKNIIKKSGAYIAFAVCLLIALTAGYLVQTKNSNNPKEVADTEDPAPAQAFITESQPAFPEDLSVDVDKNESETKSNSVKDSTASSQSTAVPTAAIKPLALSSPVSGPVSKAFSTQPAYSVTMDDWRSHSGIDIAAEAGSEVKAAEAGTVTKVGKDNLLGVYVLIDHGNKTITGYYNLFASPSVAQGQKVTKGQVVGFVGETAMVEKGDAPHLHFELTMNDKKVNPLDYIKK